MSKHLPISIVSCIPVIVCDFQNINGSFILPQKSYIPRFSGNRDVTFLSVLCIEKDKIPTRKGEACHHLALRSEFIRVHTCQCSLGARNGIGAAALRQFKFRRSRVFYRDTPAPNTRDIL